MVLQGFRTLASLSSGDRKSLRKPSSLATANRYGSYEMKTTSILIRYILLIYFIFFCIWIITQLTPLELTNVLLKQLIYESVLFGFPIATILTSLKIWQNRKSKWIALGLIIIILSLNWILIEINILRFFGYSHSVWIDYNLIATKSEQEQIVEQQIDSGAFGYDYRIVKVFKLTNFLSWITHVEGKNIEEYREQGWKIVDDGKMQIEK